MYVFVCVLWKQWRAGLLGITYLHLRVSSQSSSLPPPQPQEEAFVALVKVQLSQMDEVCLLPCFTRLSHLLTRLSHLLLDRMVLHNNRICYM